MVIAVESKPDAVAVKAQLKRIITHVRFHKSRKICLLLRYVVEETLAGRPAGLKGYSIGVAVFNKPKGYDADKDTLVRVQAKRLRDMLDEYYQEAGRDDPVIIKMSAGTYVPVFIDNSNVGAKTVPSGRGGGVFSGKPLIAAAAIGALLLISFILAGTIYFGAGKKVAKNAKTGQPAVVSAGLRAWPKLAVPEFKIVPAGGKLDETCHEIRRQVLDKLTRFKSLHIMVDGQILDADYLLSGSVMCGVKKIRVTAQLLEVSEKRIIWSHAFDRMRDEASVIESMDAISRNIAVALAEPYGVINRLETAKIAGRPASSLGGYGCLLKFLSYQADVNERLHGQVRACLEKSVREEPGFARIWAALSFMYGDEYRYGFNIDKSRNAVDLAVETAKKGVVLDPKDACTHRYLSNAYFISSQHDLAHREIHRAMELNPNDPQIFADVAWHHSYKGEWEMAIQRVEHASALTPARISWRRTPMFIYFYQKGDFAKALYEARSGYDVKSLDSYVFSAAAAVKTGNLEEARHNADYINRNYIGFKGNPSGRLKAMHIPGKMIEPLIAVLKEAGVRFKS